MTKTILILSQKMRIEEDTLCQLLASTHVCASVCTGHMHTHATLILIPISQNAERVGSLLWMVPSPAVLKGAEDPLPSPKHRVTSERLLYTTANVCMSFPHI